jgi:plastocyanin
MTERKIRCGSIFQQPASDPASFDGTTCATSALLFNGDKFTVVFPVAGNFKLVCLVHADMTGTIHVLDASRPLAHDQAFYDRVAQSESKDLLDDQDTGALKHHHSANTVNVGYGEIAATGGGSDSLSVMRFTDPDITVHAGDTIEWTNEDPITAHTGFERLIVHAAELMASGAPLLRLQVSDAFP